MLLSGGHGEVSNLEERDPCIFLNCVFVWMLRWSKMVSHKPNVSHRFPRSPMPRSIYMAPNAQRDTVAANRPQTTEI